MKAILRILGAVVFFVGSWLLLAQVNWVEHFGVKEITESSEEKLSEFIKEHIERSEEVIRDKEVLNTIDSILNTITKDNFINKDDIKVIVVNNEVVNAYALPSEYMVLNSGLIKACNSAEALAGVMAHELGHIQMQHVKKKLLKEVGVAVLVSSTSGGGGEVIQQITKTLSSTAYDRSLEEEADEKAVTYMINAEIDPEPLAEFFYELSMKEPEFMSKLDWVSTHKNSEERAEEIVTRLKSESYDVRPVLQPGSWKALQEKLKELGEDD